MAAALRWAKLGNFKVMSSTTRQAVCVKWYSKKFKRPDTPDPDPEIMKMAYPQSQGPKVYEKEVFPGEFELERPFGKIYDKKPFKMLLKANKVYFWCSCGVSKSQPLCDGSHKQLDGTSFVKIKPKFRPIKFQVEEEKEVWLCNCKQSSNRPYCDGTHKRADIQEAVRS